MATRLCVILAVLVSAKMVLAQPIFGTQMWCDTFCDDDDDDDDYDSSSSFEDFLDSLFDPCAGCDSSRPTKRRTTTESPAMKQPLNIMIPPANGLNLTLTNTGGSWLMDFIPWMANPAATTEAPATTTAKAAASTTAAGSTTAAPTTTAKA